MDVCIALSTGDDNNTVCVWTSVSEIGMVSALLFQLVMIIMQHVWTSVSEIGMDVSIALSTGDDNNTVCGLVYLR